MTASESEPRADRLHRTLIAELTQAGCFRPAPVRTFAYGAFILTGYAAACATLLTGPGMAMRLFAIVSLAFLSVHAGFLAHEAGHGAITRDRRLAAGIGQLFHTLLTGFCHSYFCRIHRRHHPHTNDRARDPDMQSNVFSMYAESAAQKSGLGALVSRHQAVLIWILVWLQGATLKIDGLQFVRRNPRTTRVDQVLVLAHVALWCVPSVLALGPADTLLNYALMTLLVGPYLGTLFLVNHIGTRVIEPEERISFFLQELSVTRNLGTTRLQHFLFGGLNNHIEHHLFPSMATSRLRAARHITREFCRRHALVYREMSWFAAAREVSQHFKTMSTYVTR